MNATKGFSQKLTFHLQSRRERRKKTKKEKTIFHRSLIGKERRRRKKKKAIAHALLTVIKINVWHFLYCLSLLFHTPIYLLVFY